jgi:hypothetical protein
MVDRALSRRHRMADFFFCIQPLQPAERLQRILSDARDSVVELETHPVDPEEYNFLAGGEIFRMAENITIANRYALPGRNGTAKWASPARDAGL